MQWSNILGSRLEVDCGIEENNSLEGAIARASSSSLMVA